MIESAVNVAVSFHGQIYDLTHLPSISFLPAIYGLDDRSKPAPQSVTSLAGSRCLKMQIVFPYGIYLGHGKFFTV